MPTPANISLSAKLEAVLFAAGKPLTLKKLAEVTSSSASEVQGSLKELQALYESGGRGFQLIVNQGEAALATHPDLTELVQEFVKREEYGELTRPQLEALSVLSYRGPLTKSELEQVRGVNCSLILRNLMIRGLVQEMEDGPVAKYQVTVELLRHLGISSVEELPEYHALSSDENLTRVLAHETESKPA